MHRTIKTILFSVAIFLGLSTHAQTQRFDVNNLSLDACQINNVKVLIEHSLLDKKPIDKHKQLLITGFKTIVNIAFIIGTINLHVILFNYLKDMCRLLCTGSFRTPEQLEKWREYKLSCIQYDLESDLIGCCIDNINKKKNADGIPCACDRIMKLYEKVADPAVVKKNKEFLKIQLCS